MRLNVDGKCRFCETNPETAESVTVRIILLFLMRGNTIQICIGLIEVKHSVPPEFVHFSHIETLWGTYCNRILMKALYFSFLLFKRKESEKHMCIRLLKNNCGFN